MADVTINSDHIHLDDFRCDDPALRELLLATPEADRVEKINHVIAVGSRGLASMGIGVSVAQVGEAVERIVTSATDKSERTLAALFDEGTRHIATVFDPDDRTSVVARTLSELEVTAATLLERLDPACATSHTGTLLSRLDDALAEGGALDDRLNSSMDPHAEGSPFAALRKELETGLRDLRDLLIRAEGRSEEAERGTVKGFDFEDVVEARTRAIAGGLGGCVVERTSTTSGTNGVHSLVGDVVVTLDDGFRIVIEAKNTSKIGLAGSTGILEELDRAMANRDAQFAICVSARDAYPNEVGTFGVYGNRALVVDSGDGDLLTVAIRWARMAMRATQTASHEVDTEVLLGRLERIRAMASRFSKSKRALSGIRNTVDDVRADLDGMRCDLLDLVDDAQRELERSDDTQRPENELPIRVA